MKGFLLKLAAASFFAPLALWVVLAYNAPKDANEVFLLAFVGIWVLGLGHLGLSRFSEWFRQQVAAWRERFVTCQCGSCGTFVEFPLRGAGESVPCPGCSTPLLLVRMIDAKKASVIRLTLQTVACIFVGAIVFTSITTLSSCGEARSVSSYRSGPDTERQQRMIQREQMTIVITLLIGLVAILLFLVIWVLLRKL